MVTFDPEDAYYVRDERRRGRRDPSDTQTITLERGFSLELRPIRIMRPGPRGRLPRASKGFEWHVIDGRGRPFVPCDGCGMVHGSADTITEARRDALITLRHWLATPPEKRGESAIPFAQWFRHMKYGRDPKRRPLIEKRWRVGFVDKEGIFHSIYVRAKDEPDAILAAERRMLGAGERIRPKWLKGFGWTPRVEED